MSGRLELNFVDVSGAPLADTLTIRLRHQVLHDERRVEGHDGRKRLAIADLHAEPQGVYALEVRAECYRPVSRFVTVRSGAQDAETVTMPIHPDRAEAIFPEYDGLDPRVRSVLERSHNVVGHEGMIGPALYEALSDHAAAGLLNIARKSLTMPFKGGADLMEFISLVEIRRDRCFVDLPRAIHDQMVDLVEDDVFEPVDGSLHDPPAGFVRAGSFKTPDLFGNLQMTFFLSNGQCRADIDIDDANGLLHFFQVARNHLKDRTTHSYDIHQILVAHQHLHPGYDLIPKMT
jgi:hypothetical protein